jgi:PIN domain nuclease of toxin-antitoxin system
MNYLLDTHVLLWAIFESWKLPPGVKSLILNPENTIYVSLISFWEISLKYSLGKLELDDIMPDAIPGFSREAGFKTLVLSEADVASFYKLPRIGHKDPFDRLILWQAINNDLTLISKDGKLSDYKEFGLSITW